MSKEEWQVGWYADYYDASARQWTMIRILEIKQADEEIYFEFDGWPKKWNSYCKIASRKLAPFRSKSIGYTGQKENAIREWTFRPEELQECEEKLRNLIHGTLSTGSSGLTTQFLRGQIFTLVDNLLVYPYKKNEHMKVVPFFCTVLEYIVEWLKKAAELFPIYYDSLTNPDIFLTDDKVALAVAWPELLITLRRIFGLDPRTCKFHRTNSWLMKDYDPWYGSSVKSGNLTSYFINYFGKKEGIDLLISLLSQKEEKKKIPFEFLKDLPIFEIGSYFDKKLNETFIQAAKDLIIQRIDMISNKELKELNKDHISEVLLKTKRLLSDCFKKPNLEEIDKVDLSVISKFFKSPFMEKRLRAINEIKDLIERSSKSSSISLAISSKSIAEWIIKEQIVKQIFSYSHPEMMKRVSDIVIFLNDCDYLSKELLDLFWDSAVGKHDSVVIETHRAILDVSEHLKPDFLSHLYKNMKEVPVSLYDEKFLKLVKDFMSVMIPRTTGKTAGTENQGLEIFLPLINSPPSASLCDLAIEYLLELIRLTSLRSRVSYLLEVVCRKVIQEQSVASHLKLVNCLLSRNGHSFIDDTLRTLELVNIKLMDLVLENFCLYMKKNNDDLGTLVENCYSHRQNIEIRLKLVGSLMNSTAFTFSYFQEVWNVFEEAGPQERDLFFEWLETATREKFQRQLVLDVFSNILCKIPAELFTVTMFNCFKTFFLISNSTERNVESKYGGFYTRLQEKVLGFNNLLDICIQAQIPEIFTSATALLIALNLRLSKSLLGIKQVIWKAFVESVLTSVRSPAEATVFKMIQILQNFLEENYVLGNSTSNEIKTYWYKSSLDKDYKKITVNTSDTIRSIKKRLEMVYRKPWNSIHLRFSNTLYDASNDNSQISSLPVASYFIVDFCNPKAEEIGPKEFLSQSEEVQGFLFEAISDHTTSYSHEAWNLLTSLHINNSIKQSLIELKVPVKKLIDGSSLYRLLYSLLIVKELIQDERWVKKFNENKGFEYIIQIFQDHDVFSFNDSTCMKYGTVMVILIEECFKFSLRVDSKFVNQLLDCLVMIGKYAQDPEDEKIVNVGASAKNIFSEILRNDSELLGKAMKKYEKIDEFIINNLILCCNFQYSNIVMNLSLEILGKCEDLLQFITKKMFDLAGTAVKSSKSSTFWTLLTQLVNESHGSEHLTKHVRLVLKLLKKDPGETSSKEKRVQLHGLLSVIKSAIEEKLLKARNRVIKLVLQDFLFEISSEKNLPKCKNDESRNLAFDILEKSIEIRGKNVRGLIEYLSKFHENTHWRTRNIHDWNYSPASEEKSITGFVGLKNIGNVCYMNSTLQQLYNIPTFCEELLRTNSSDNENSNLRSLQFIFTGLKTSAKQYMSPKRLCLSFKDWEGRPINVAEQMDADEFFNNLMDKLENEMKGMKSEHSIRNHFGGVQITECIGKGACRHKSERAEVFMTLPVQVKNKKSLIESLESFVEGEILENDNAYECDYCESKVTALRRVCIKHLPNILIIVLRRFEFDFDTMNRLKVNDYCEFPMEINMEPYTQEGLERKEMMKEQKEPIAKKFPEDYYKFSLKGITIHAGTAECGHYYSYIKNRRSGNWFEFNDIFVNAFDPDDIPAEAYGGVERWNSFHSSNYSTNTREKYRNAYLLFYERDKHYSYRCKEDEGLEELVIDHSNSQLVSFDEVSEENERYWRCKSIFSPEYLQFVLKLLKNAKGNSQIIQFCCCAFLVIFIRSKDLLRSFDFLIQLEKALVSDDLCKWLSQLICVPAVYKELIVECPIEDKSRLIVQVVTSAFKGLKTVDLRIALNNFLSLFESAAFARNSGNYFKLLSVLVTADPGYAASLGVHVLILNFLANEPVGQTFTADFSIDNYLLGYDPRDQVSFEKVADEKCPCFLPVILNDLAEHFTEDLSKTLFNKSIMKSLANVNHKVGTRNVALLYSSLTGKVKDKKKEYLNFLITLFKENDYDRARIYFRQFKVLVEREENPETVLGLINEAMKETRNYIRVTEVSIDFLFKLCQKYGKVKEWFVRSKEVKWIEQWISNSSYNQRSGFSTFKRTNVMMSNSLPGKSFQERNEIYRKIMKNQLLENDEYDSDDEFPVETLENSSRIDLYDTMAFRWVKANAVLRSKRILAVKLETSNEKGFRWFEIDSEFIAPDGAKVTRNGRI